MRTCFPGWAALLLWHIITVRASTPLDFATLPASQNARPLSLAHSFERFDLDQAVLDERKYKHNVHAMLKTPHTVPRRGAYKSNLFATDASMIAVDFVCNPPPWATEPVDETCAKVQKAFQGVFQHVEDAFDLKRPIKVKFEYSSFCAAQTTSHAHVEQRDDPTPALAAELPAMTPLPEMTPLPAMTAAMDGAATEDARPLAQDAHFRFAAKKPKKTRPAECDATNGLLGYAAPAAFWVPDVADAVTGLKYSYPQALVKQLLAERRSSINFNEFDIFARFNADQEDGLWFKDELPFKPIRPNQYDFQYIVLHEFMHGMGLVSSWNMPFDGYASKRGGTPGSAMLAPILVPERPDVPVPTPLATTIFDKYISTTSAVPQPAFFNHYAAGVFDAVRALPSGAVTGAFYKATLLDAQANQAAARAFQAATTARALQFSFPDGSSMLLHSEEGRFLSGTSIVHVNYDAYTGTADFLMRPYANNGATLESLGKGRPFGHLTLRVFQTLGYAIRDKALAAYAGRPTQALPFVEDAASAQRRVVSGQSSGAASYPLPFSTALLPPFVVAVLALLF